MAKRDDAKGKLTGRHVLFIVLAFFGVMIFANVVFIRAAIETFPGVTEKKSYIQGLHYNEALEQRAAQAQLGWNAEITGVTRDSETGRISVRMMKGETALTGLSVTGLLKRPAHRGADQPLIFVSSAEGVYEADVGAFAPGVWDLALRAESRAGEALDVDARIIAP